MVIAKIVNLESDMKEVKQKLRRFDGLFDRVLEGQDKILGFLRKKDAEQASIRHAIQRHEERISALERNM